MPNDDYFIFTGTDRDGHACLYIRHATEEPDYLTQDEMATVAEFISLFVSINEVLA